MNPLKAKFPIYKNAIRHFLNLPFEHSPVHYFHQIIVICVSGNLPPVAPGQIHSYGQSFEAI